jgi:hypothetical protein
MHAKVFLLALFSGLSAAAAVEPLPKNGCAKGEWALSDEFTHNDDDNYDSPNNSCKTTMAPAGED